MPRRLSLPFRRSRSKRSGRPRVVHVAAFDRNVGDNALNHAIERMLEPEFEIDRMELVANPFDSEVVDELNRYDAIIFGGGGVIHSCSGGSSRKNRERTGTMWNMELHDVERLRAPMILYGVGYNRFAGEPEPLPAMVSFFDVLAERGDLIRFRNDGSVERLEKDLPELSGRFEEIPDPGLFCRGRPVVETEPYALVQIATDRPDFRFPNGIDAFVDEMNELVGLGGIRSVLLPHTNSDAKIYARLADRLRVSEIAPLDISFANTLEAMDRYRNARFTISTRGHAQICSIGNRTPTFAVSTHPKVAGFMNSLGLDAACYDVHAHTPSEGRERFEAFLTRLDEHRLEIDRLVDGFDAEIADFNATVTEFVAGRSR